MSQAWRWSLRVIVALTVFGGFMPNALLSGSSASASTTTSAQRPPSDPTQCGVSSCGRGAPTSPTPSPTMVAVLAAGILGIAATGQLRRRLRAGAVSLPRGRALVLFHPPQFS